MLEGQVAVLSSGYLSAEESLYLLDALKQSALYRKGQDSYILYPNKALPGFLQKNILPKQKVEDSGLLTKLLADGDVTIIEKDIKSAYHFNGNFRNAEDVKQALNNLASKYQLLVAKEKEQVLQIFEDVFNHKEFTGRSGTFYGYEGLGSIYWHMVSKLALAVEETCLRAMKEKAGKETTARLIQHYYEINEGIGVHKSPELFGAFPFTPYSHTPLHRGAQQPGMTGQVKEDILCRMGELGVQVQDGRLYFHPQLLCSKEFLKEKKQVVVVNVHGEKQAITIEKDALLFTYCQVPVMYIISNREAVETERTDGTKYSEDGLALNETDTASVLNRTGVVKLIKVYLPESQLLK
jgi:hypothetical protein